MHILKPLFGVLCLFAGLICALGAFSSAGGMHGWNEFRADRLLSSHNNSVTWTLGSLCLFVVGSLLTFRRSKA